MKYILILTALFSTQANASIQVYGSQHMTYRGWSSLKGTECGSPAFEMGNPTKDMENPVFMAALIHAFIMEGMIPTEDGITDDWCSDLDELQATGYFYGDCDNSALTHADAWNRAGFHRGNIYLATVKPNSWLDGRIYPAGHPNHSEASHIVAILVIGGTWWVADNLHYGLRPIEDVMGVDKDYLPVGIINYGNYGEGKDNDTSAGFVRFWVD